MGRFVGSTLLTLCIVISVIEAQTPSKLNDVGIDHYGTCATTIIAPFGASFIVDSRVTDVIGNRIVGQHRGCKVLLARPSVLLVGVGLNDTTGRGGHWNALDAAAVAVNTLPENPSEAQIDQLAPAWAQTLIRHFRQGAEDLTALPQLVPLSELLLITRVGDTFYFKRTRVEWDGVQFHWTLEGQVLDKSVPQVEYAGLCRRFVSHDDGKGGWHNPEYRTPLEDQRMGYWGRRKSDAKTADDLRAVALGLEMTLTDIDVRLQGKAAAIGPPYATAEWAEGDKGWTTHFDAACESNPRTPPETSGK